MQEEDEVSPDRAYLTLCINYLGFSLEHGLITDGGNDCGIDFIEHTADGATILQTKSVEFFGRIVGRTRFSDRSSKDTKPTLFPRHDSIEHEGIS